MSLRIVVLGHAISARAGNDLAAFYRLLLPALAGRGHGIMFLECNGVVAEQDRDVAALGWCNLQFYDGLAGLDAWRPRLADADLVLIDTNVPDGAAVGRLARDACGGVLALLDRDTPNSLRRLVAGGDESFSPATVRTADLYLTASGGLVPRDLERRFGARRARVFYPVADPIPLPLAPDAQDDGAAEAAPSRWDLGYLGDHDPAIQPLLERLMIDPARLMPRRRFVVAGSGWPVDLRWPENVAVVPGVADGERADFDARCAWGLVLPRPDEIATGWTPGRRLMEVAACATPVITAPWRGLSNLFTPGREILAAAQAEEVIRALGRPEGYRAAIGRAGRARVRMAHTPGHGAARLESLVADLAQARQRRRVLVPA